MNNALCNNAEHYANILRMFLSSLTFFQKLLLGPCDYDAAIERYDVKITR